MIFAEKKLYHQIHPFKLTADISASIVTLYLFWLHYLLLGIILHFLVPILGSIFVIKYINLERQKSSTLGKYIKKYMNRWMEALRLMGDIITVLGAWYHSFLIIIFGLIVILGAWLNGKFHT